MIRPTSAPTSRMVPTIQTTARLALAGAAHPHGVEDRLVLLVHQPLLVGLGARLGQVLRVLGFLGFFPLLPTGERLVGRIGPRRWTRTLGDSEPRIRLDGAGVTRSLTSPPTGAFNGFARWIDTDAPRSFGPLAVPIRPLSAVREPGTGIHSRGWVSARLAPDRDGREARASGSGSLKTEQ